MAAETPIAKFDALMDAKRYEAAADLAKGLRTRQPRNGQWWYACARAAFAIGNIRIAYDEIAQAAKLLPDDPAIALQQAIIDHRIGHTEVALTRLRALVARGSRLDTEATVVLADVLSRSNQQAELDGLLARGGAWTNDPRAQLFVARRLKERDPAGSIAMFERILRSDVASHVRRIAGFEAVKMLDATEKYRAAYDLALETHRTTGSTFDVGSLEHQVESQRRLLATPTLLGPRRVPEVRGVSIVVSLPRSGTTLIEQMFDRHPAITGIGEYEGVRTLGESALSSGHWPHELASTPAATVQSWQDSYVTGATFLRRPDATWSFDKTLHAWRWLPVIALALPGAVLIAIDRDPRDTAVSSLLGNFHPVASGWTSSIDSIRRVIAAHRSILPEMLDRVGLSHEALVYENFIDDPRGHSEKCFARLGLPMDEATLSPEKNTRMVLTLSHEQVRKPINRGSIGRWRNYEWAFDDSWRDLVAAHDARRV